MQQECLNALGTKFVCDRFASFIIPSKGGKMRALKFVRKTDLTDITDWKSFLPCNL